MYCYTPNLKHEVLQWGVIQKEAHCIIGPNSVTRQKLVKNKFTSQIVTSNVNCCISCPFPSIVGRSICGISKMWTYDAYALLNKEVR